MVEDLTELSVSEKVGFNSLVKLDEKVIKKRCTAYADELAKVGIKDVQKFIASVLEYKRWWEESQGWLAQLKKYKNPDLSTLVSQIKESVTYKESVQTTYALCDLAEAMQLFLDAGHEIKRLDDRTLICPVCKNKFGPQLIGKKIPECKNAKIARAA